MTLQEAKNEVAEKYPGYENWKHMELVLMSKKTELSLNSLCARYDEVIILYAQSQTEELRAEIKRLTEENERTQEIIKNMIKMYVKP